MKRKLPLSKLREELQMLNYAEMAMIKAGGGVVTSGSGTASDPYVITTVFYYNDSTINDPAFVNGLTAALGQYNGLGSFSNGGTYYKFNLSAEASSNPAAAAGTAGITHGDTYYHYGATIGASGTADSNATFGTATEYSINVDRTKVNNVFQNGYFTTTGIANPTPSGEEFKPSIGSKKDWYEFIFAHEIGHTLGLNHNKRSAVMRSELVVTAKEGSVFSGGASSTTFSVSLGKIKLRDVNMAIDLMNSGNGANSHFLRNPFAMSQNSGEEGGGASGEW